VSGAAHHTVYLAHYYRDVSAPETKEAFTEIAQFFDKHLGK
jgi:hypothetical protein